MAYAAPQMTYAQAAPIAYDALAAPQVTYTQAPMAYDYAAPQVVDAAPQVTYVDAAPQVTYAQAPQVFDAAPQMTYAYAQPEMAYAQAPTVTYAQAPAAVEMAAPIAMQPVETATVPNLAAGGASFVAAPVANQLQTAQSMIAYPGYGASYAMEGPFKFYASNQTGPTTVQPTVAPASQPAVRPAPADPARKKEKAKKKKKGGCG